MSIKSVLVVVQGGPGDTARLKEALVLARHHRAGVVALFVKTPAERRSADGTAPADIASPDRRQADMTAVASEIAARTLAKQADVQLGWFCEEGDAAECAADHAVSSDLAIVAPELARTLVFLSAAPVLAFPDHATPGLPRKALIAWDGSREASRAVRDAVPLVSSASTIDVVAVDPLPNRSAAPYLGRALAHSDLKIRLHERSSGGRHPGTLLLQEASALNADLIVMGAYGHASIRDPVLGGATDVILKSSGIPLLLAH